MEPAQSGGQQPVDTANSSAREEPTEIAIAQATASDQPAKNDLIGFEPYVEAIAGFLANKDTRPPLTLSVEGDWGSGKSSFMLQLRAALEKPPHGMRAVSFNPWRHEKQESLWSAFALEFLRQISGPWSIRRVNGVLKLLWLRFDLEGGWLDLVRFVAWMVLSMTLLIVCLAATWRPEIALLEQFLKEKDPQSWMTDLVRAALKSGGVVGSVLIALWAWKRATRIVGSPLSIDLRRHIKSLDYESRVAFIERFHEDFNKIVKAFADGEEKIAVFIDDLDRCDPVNTADLLQAMNLMISDSAPLIFVLGIDRQRVAASIAFKHEKILPYITADGGDAPAVEGRPTVDPRLALEFGYLFLEKFIQLPFRIPRPDVTNIEVFLSSLAAPPGTVPRHTTKDRTQIVAGLETIRVLVAPDSPAVQEAALLVAPALNNNPRRLKQFINLFRLHAYLAHATGLFQAEADPVKAGWTLKKLAKFSAISLRWPGLLDDLEKRPNLLTWLQNLVHTDEPRSDPGWESLDGQEQGIVLQWLRRETLVAFLKAGCVDVNGARDLEGERESGFAELDVTRVLNVSPSIVRAATDGSTKSAVNPTREGADTTPPKPPLQAEFPSDKSPVSRVGVPKA